MSLPVLVTPADVERLVNFLRSKPTGVSTAQASSIMHEVFDKRKVSAYVLWALVKKDGGKLKLDDRGWSLARGTKSIDVVMREILQSHPAYFSALERIYHQGAESVITSDIAAYWNEYYADQIGTEIARTMMEQALCFFRVAEAARLGTTLTGRRGSPTRFQPNRQSLSRFLEAQGANPTASEQHDSREETENVPMTISNVRTGDQASHSEATPRVREARQLRIFVAHGRNPKLVAQVKDILTQVAGIDCEIAVKDEETAIPVPEKVFGAMKRCTASVIIVSREQVRGENAGSGINDNVLIEIGAAFMLYDKRVVLLWERGVPVPSNLQGLYRCEFDGDDLALPEVIKLMKVLRKLTEEDPGDRKAG